MAIYASLLSPTEYIQPLFSAVRMDISRYLNILSLEPKTLKIDFSPGLKS